MKEILISIKPQYVAKILNKEKTIEVRKKFPKDYVGWVYVYCTKDKSDKETLIEMHKRYGLTKNANPYGKVVCRFWCDNVEEIHCNSYGLETSEHWYGTKEIHEKELLEKTCLSFDELDNYLNWSNGYAIHINDLKIFDNSKEISEFYKVGYNDEVNKVFEQPHTLREQMALVQAVTMLNQIKHVPSNFCYVEV